MAIDEKKLLESLERHEDEARDEMERFTDNDESYHYNNGQAEAYYEMARLIKKGIFRVAEKSTNMDNSEEFVGFM